MGVCVHLGLLLSLCVPVIARRLKFKGGCSNLGLYLGFPLLVYGMGKRGGRVGLSVVEFAAEFPKLAPLWVRAIRSEKIAFWFIKRCLMVCDFL